MKILVVGGGPAGLTFAMLARRILPGATVTVLERNARGVTYGWGVVFPEALLRGVARHCRETAAAIVREATIWEDQHVRVRGARAVHLGRYGYSISRARLENLMASRAERVGVELRYQQDVAGPADLPAADLIVAADGANSRLREAGAADFRTRIERGRNRFIWLGTSRDFPAFTFGFEQTPAGWIWFHAYRYAPGASTFIAECSPETWQGLGFDRLDASGGARLLEKLFANYLDGHPVMDQMGALGRVGWQTFGTITNEAWVRGNVVLLGDAAHTAHFSIGSGTLLAVGDAVALAEHLHREMDLQTALQAYQAERRPAVERFQSGARNSARWFENVCQFIGKPPVDFGYSLLRRRDGMPAPPEPSPRWRYQIHRAMQVGFMPEVRRQITATRRMLRGPRYI